MQMLSTELKQCVILQHSGAVEFISEQQAEFIVKAQSMGQKGIPRENGKGYLAFSSIADIMTLDKYYEKYPDKIPSNNKEFVTEPIIPLTEEQIKINRRGVMRGLKKYIDEQLAIGITPKKALSIYNNKLEGFSRVYKSN